MNQAREGIDCEEVYSMGITGRGAGMVVFDTGVYLHEGLKDRVTAFADFVDHRISPYDDNGHGTHITVVIGGGGISSDGKYRRAAPGCSLISVKTLDQKRNGYATNAPTGPEWIRENRDRYNIRIVNIFVGSLSRRSVTENSILVRGVSAAWDDGLVVAVAVGNHGLSRMTITTPGISRKAITVGRSDGHKEVDVMGSCVVDYSGGGPTLAYVYKPDLITSGSGIISCCNEPGKYSLKSGISMSTPLMSGVIALLLEKYPDAGNKDVKLHIKERVPDLGLPHNQQGWGKLDVRWLLK